MTAWTRTIKGQRIWVVGASSGIGAELARRLRDRGAQVAISGRREQLLEGVAQGSMTVAAVDVTNHEDLLNAAKQVATALGGLDTVIWSAAFWKPTEIDAWGREDFARHYEVNILGFNNLLDAVLPSMLSERRGHIVGISSVAGYRGFPGAEAYGSTKAALSALLESLRASLRVHNIRVTTVSPGFVRTELTEGNQFPMPFLIDVNQAAGSIVKGLERGRTEVVFPFRMAVAMKLARLLPMRSWARAMGKPPA